MIETLSSPSGQCFFTTVEGKQPYKHRYTKPVSKLEYANTVYNTLSYGLDATWKVCDYLGVYSTSYVGRVPLIKFYYGNSIPETLLDEPYNSKWSVKYDFYFVAPYTQSKYYFYFGGSGEITNFSLASYSTGFSGLGSLGFENRDYLKSTAFTLIAGNSYLCSITYKNLVDRGSGLVVLWQTTHSTSTPEKIVLSAGVCQPKSDNAFPTFSNIPLYSKIEYTERDSGANTLKFEVPFISSTSAYTYKGYYYDAVSDCYTEKVSGFQLKPYRMIRYHSGYRNASNQDQFATRFTGQIRDFKIQYDKEGNDILVVECSDYSILTKDVINLESPTPIDYWQVGYLTRVPGCANGETKPRCFDGWELHKAYEVLLTESYIDPYTFYKKKSYSNYHIASTVGPYYIEPIKSSFVNFLPIQKNYGLPVTGEADKTGAPDDSYAYKIDAGEYYQDAIDNILKSWYAKWGMTSEGYPYLKFINSPYNYVEGKSFTYLAAGYHKVDSIYSFKGSYIETTTVNANASCNATGKKFVLMLGAGPLCSTCRVTVKHDTTTISTARYNLYISTAHYYYDGALKDTGTNISKINIANGLNYDSYKIVVENMVATKRTRIEGLLCYHEEYEVADNTFYTGPTAQASIISLSVDKDFQDQRTDCIVLGRRLGTLLQMDDEGNEVALNPNNQTNLYLQSATRDLNAVYKSTAINYVGRPRNTIIVDPAITSQQQADFISYNVISEYGTVSKKTSWGIQGDPLLQIDDCVAVSELFKKGVASTEYQWITGITETFDDTYTTKIETTPIKPVDSYWDKPTLNIANFGNNYIYNLFVKNRGWWGKLKKPIMTNTTSVGVWFDTAYKNQIHDIIPKFGYCRIGQEICQYNGFSTANFPSNYIVLNNLTRGLGVESYTAKTYATDHSIGNVDVVIGYLPYSKSQLPPIVSFDLLEDADVEVSIENICYQTSLSWKKDKLNNIIGNFKVDVLTNVSQTPKEGTDNYIFLKSGTHNFVWGGFDRIGRYNDSVRTTYEGSLLDTQYYARENYSVQDSIRATNYFEFSYSTGFGLFRGVIKVRPKSNPNNVFPYYTDNATSKGYLKNIGGEYGCIKQLLVDPGRVDLKFSTSGLFYVRPNLTLERKISPYGVVGGLLRYDRTNLQYWSTVTSGFGLYVGTNYPYCKPLTTAWPSFILNRSNLHPDNGVPQGLKFYVQDYSKNNNSDIQRNWIAGSLQFRVIQLGMYQQKLANENNAFAIFDPMITDGQIENTSGYISANNYYYVDISNLIRGKTGGFIPTDWVSKFKTNINVSGYDLFVSNYIVFANTLVDFSGRIVDQPRKYKPYVDFNSICKTFDTATYGAKLNANKYSDPMIAYKKMADESLSGFKSYQAGALPYYMGISTVNCGFYEFANKKNQNESDQWLYYYFDYIPESEGFLAKYIQRANYITFNKNLRGEFKYYSKIDSFNTDIYRVGWPSNRSNYITWIDEGSCRRIAFFESSAGGVHTRFGQIIKLFQNTPFYIPNLWVHFERGDFS